MIYKKKLLDTIFYNCIVTILFLLPCIISFSQKTLPPTQILKFTNGKSGNLFGTSQGFIQNVGQYGTYLSHHDSMGRILYGYEGFDMPVLFTSNGLIHLQRKIENSEEKDLEDRDRKEFKSKGKIKEKDLEEQEAVDKTITMEWLNANPQVQIISENQQSAYHTYASVPNKAYSFQKLTYKELYPGIDVVFYFNSSKAGFEYSLLVKPGADLSQVKFKFGGDVHSIHTDKNGNLIIQSDIEGIRETVPISYYGSNIQSKLTSEINTSYKIKGNEVSFSLPQNYDPTRTLIIDPFVSATGNLTGLNSGKAKDVDFDYNGNVYVTGGGSGTVHELAKFDANGILQWTFSGTLAIPSWTFGSYWGGWMVEKPSGNVYLGQGFNPFTGFQVIRVSTTGLYDNYITTANPNFREAWKMIWSCNNGSPQILVAGGGTNSNINFGFFTPPSTTIGSLNVTGIPYSVSTGWAQDIVDFIIDPVTNDMYTLYGSLIGTPSLTNKIYKNTAPYSGASVAWNVPSGFTSVQEIANRPYLFGGQIDNSANIFAINSSYLFYWDGKNLKAFDKNTGTGVGTPLITANTVLMQGGIIADACNDIFVGDANGVIKVYKFNGTIFDDAAAPDIVIPGFAGKAVYDLAYDESKKLLYVSGDGFVAAFDISSYCPSTQYSLNVAPDCITSTATVSVSPVPPPGSTVTYTLNNGALQLATNTSGVFPGLLPGINYTIVATINLACNGTQAIKSFTLPGPIVTTTQSNTTCGNFTGSATVTASGAIAPYTYSIDGINFQSNTIFNNLASGIYTITAKDANGCTGKTTLTILNSNGPLLTFTNTNASCGNNNGSITASVTGGAVPYQYTINGTTFQSINFFNGLAQGNYTLTVKDANGCSNSAVVTITGSNNPTINAIPSSAVCGNPNGTISAFGSGGTAPLQYSINGNIFQSSNLFSNLSPGSYIVTVKDSNGCTQNTTVLVDNAPSPVISAVSTPAACNNINGTITASASGGIAPLQFSLNGGFFQTSNIFTGLATGTYSVTVKDNSGCTATTTISVTNTGGPTVTATSTSSACNTNTGSITASASGGVPGYQFSINGTFFQASNIFNGLPGGNYIVYVRDLNNCIGTVSISVATSTGPSLTVVSIPTSCNGNTGVINATGTGGVAPLLYSIDGVNYQIANIFNNLTTGIYIVSVKDVNGCIKSTSVTISNTSGLSLNTGSISSSCNTNTGSITANATGGTLPISYSIDNINYQSSNTFSNLTPGTYTIYAKDATGCVVSKQVSVTATTGPSLSVSVLQNATCGTSSGVVKATGTGGVPPLLYNVDGGAFQSTNLFINVSAGTHTISVKDFNGCSSTQSITITNSGTGAAPTDITYTLRDALACTGGTGRIKNLKGVPSGGGNNYTFSLSGGAFTTANQFFKVNPGTYVITTKNQSGCTVSKIVTLGSGTPATATSTVTPSACGSSTGTITLTGVGVNTPYHASIDNGVTWVTFASTFTFTGLGSGTYPIIIADDADFTTGPPDIPGACLTTIFVAVPSTGGPSISVSQINATCSSGFGSINVTGSSGAAPYTYNINGGAYFTSGVFNNLAPGNYAVTVKDATGCSTGTNVIITNQTAPTVTAIVQATSCNNNNGSIIATGSGGTAPLQYSIDGTTFQSSNSFVTLQPGAYTVYVKDANNCYGTTNVSVLNTPLPKVTAFIIAATCNNSDGSIIADGSGGAVPYTFSIDGIVYQSSNTFANLSAGFYSVRIKDANGCVTTTGISITNTTAPVINSTVITSASCDNANGSISISASGGVAPLQYSIDGVSFQSANTFSNLLPGNYAAYVKDVNGCLNTKQFTIGNNTGPQTLNATVVNASCGSSNGSITAIASGGVATLQYSIDGLNYQAGAAFSNLSSGNYTLSVKDVNGCIKSIEVSVINLQGPVITTSTSPSSCGSSDGTITVNVTNGTLPFLYSINGSPFQPNNIFTGLAVGNYTITVKDAKGCSNTTNAVVNGNVLTIVPKFNQIPPICSGDPLQPLPLVSLNGITGTWSPALNNTVTTTYTFTPGPGQCAAVIKLTITVNPKPGPLIIYHN